MSTVEPPDGPGADLRFPCPRCGRQATERLYGPCGSCRTELGAAAGAGERPDAGDAPGSSRFEPGLHVVPNHVATKE